MITMLKQMITGILDDQDKKALNDGNLKGNLGKKIETMAKEPDLAPAMFKSLDSYIKRNEISDYYLNILKDSLNMDPIVIPYMYRDDFQVKTISQIAEIIKPGVTAEMK